MKTDLHVAVLEEQIEIVYNLINKGCNVHEKDSDGQTALHVAVESKNSSIIKLLIDVGSNVNEKDNQGNTPLHFTRNHVENEKLLLDAGADPNLKNSNGEIPLHFYVIAMDFNNLKNLLDYGVAVNARDNNEKTALYYAVLTNNHEIVKLLLAAGADINAGCAKKGHYTPVELAILSKNVSVLQLFFDAGVNFNTKNEEGDTPLRFAVECEDLNIIKLLVENGGADINIERTNDMYSPLEMAIVSRNIDVLKFLIDFNPDVNKKTHNGDTLLHIAAEHGNSKIVKLLLDAGADVNVKNDAGESPIYNAISSENINVLKLLVSAGADVNAKDHFGYTPLHTFAALSSIENILLFLLNSGADVMVRQENGNTPLHEAYHTDNVNILKILIRNGGNVNERNTHGDTTLSCLVEDLKDDEISENIDVLEKKLRLIITYTDVNLCDNNGKNILSRILKSLHSSLKETFFSEVILEHVAKFKSLNFLVDPRLLSTITLFSNYNDCFTECTMELEIAKKTKLNKSWVTFFNLLVDSKSKLVKYAGNEDLVKDFLKTDIEIKFPIYGRIMQSNMHKGINGRKLFDSSANTLSYLLPVFNPTHLVIKDILDVLSKKDWNNLSEKKR